jgi:RNA polymerase sigma-70 factor (ECF subfamily)
MHSSNNPIPVPNTDRLQPIECKPPRSTGKATDTDIVMRAQAGDHEAFSDLYSRHKIRVFAICLRIVRDFAMAEDLTQEVFLQVHRKLASFRGESAFTTWLHRLAVNTVLMHLRKRVLSVVSLEQIMTNGTEEHIGRGLGARDLLQAGAVDRLTIDRAVDTLAPGYRSIFVLHDVQGFDHGEIASMLNCSCGNTKSQLHKARRVLRGALGAQPESGRNSKGKLPTNMFPPRLRKDDQVDRQTLVIGRLSELIQA